MAAHSRIAVHTPSLLGRGKEHRVVGLTWSEGLGIPFSNGRRVYGGRLTPILVLRVFAPASQNYR